MTARPLAYGLAALGLLAGLENQVAWRHDRVLTLAAMVESEGSLV